MNKYTAKYVFYYLLSLVSLIFISISVGIILFSIIDLSIVDVTSSGHHNYDHQLKFAISALLVSTPIFYFIATLIAKGFRKQEISVNSGIRRWLIYLILFVSSLIILGSLLGTINTFLSGDLTLRFIFKILSVLIIAGLVFAYYLYSIKREEIKKGDKNIKLFLYLSLIIIIASFIASFFFIDSPQKARDKKLDNITISHIDRLESGVNEYYNKYKILPNDIKEVEKVPGIYINSSDYLNARDNSEIEYHKLSDDSFEFCTKFKTNSINNFPRKHKEGWDCLSGEIWSKQVLSPNLSQEIIQE